MNPEPVAPMAPVDAEPVATPESTPPRSRRALLAAALGGLAGSVATALGRPAETRAAAGAPLILGQQNFAGSSATRLSATSSGGAFWMTQNGSGSGVRGESINGTGGVFETRHADRQGLLAQNIAPGAGTGAAVRADGGSNIGIYATTDNNQRAAVRAVNTAASYSSGAGLYAQASSANNAVHAVAAGGNGVLADSSTGQGVFGRSTGYYGVAAISTNYIGMTSQVNNTEAAFYAYSSGGDGVYAVAPGASAFAGNFVGKLTASGTKSFRIDHPADPERRYLYHYSIESSEVLNLYSGTVRSARTVRRPSSCLRGSISSRATFAIC